MILRSDKICLFYCNYSNHTSPQSSTSSTIVCVHSILLILSEKVQIAFCRLNLERQKGYLTKFRLDYLRVRKYVYVVVTELF